MLYSKRRKNLGQRRKRSNRKSNGSKRLRMIGGEVFPIDSPDDKLLISLQDSYNSQWYDIFHKCIPLIPDGDVFAATLNNNTSDLQQMPMYNALIPYRFNYKNRLDLYRTYINTPYFLQGESIEYMEKRKQSI
jgi:hypothetical protein